MALIRYGEGQQRSGSMGATVYSHNRYGAYIRARSVPVNPNTDRQVVVRNALRNLSISWENTLTPAQRAAWNDYGANVTWKNRLGDSVKLTGASHYIRSNALLLQSGLAPIDDAPVIFNIGRAEQGLGVIASEATQLITYDVVEEADWASETGGHQFLFAGLPQNANIRFFGGPFRLGGLINGADGAPPAGPFPFLSPFPIAEGQRVWIQTRIARADGRLSEFARVNFLVGA